MSQVTVKLFRLLHRVRRDYRKAQIPLVGIVGFNTAPILDPRPQLAGAFRGTDSPDSARHGSDGFRALRQAQQQLEVLRGSEEETREALQYWFQLCQSWAIRLHEPSARARAAAGGNSSTGGSAGGGSSDSAQGDGGAGGQAIRLQQLAAALEEGALLVDCLYEANHFTIEDFGDKDEEEVGKEEEPGAEASGSTAVLAAAGAVAAAASSSTGSAAASGRQEGSGCGTSASGDLLPDAIRCRGAEPASTQYGGVPAPLLTDSVSTARRQLDELALTVMAAHPALFARGESGDGGGVRSSSGLAEEGLLRQQLEAISQVLFQQLKFKHEPVEWVYDGLAPALLPQVLKRRRGIPLSLAVMYSSVARRLGLAALPVKATTDGTATVAEGPASLHSLPPDVAARQAGRTVALAPPLDSWLVAAAASTGREQTRHQGPSSDAELFVDVDRRGRVLTAEEARRRFVELPVAPLTAVLPASPAELWAELARVMVTAHTRRGESDLVAYWLVQVLALDHRSPEWQVMAAQ